MYMLKKYGQILILLLFYENNNADQVVDAFIQRSMHVRFIVSKNFFALHAVSLKKPETKVWRAFLKISYHQS